MANFLLDPAATVDYAVDWRPWLAAGETIASHAVTTDSGVTVASHSEANGVVTIWLSGGTLNTRATITCHVTTSTGRVDDRSFTVLVVNR